MRAFAVALAGLTLLGAPAFAAPSDKAAALAAGDWRTAAVQGASGGDIVRALQARGQLADVSPDECVVTIDADNRVPAVPMTPLPALPADAGRTTNLSGAGFTFTAPSGTITLYPSYVQASFAPGTTRPHP